MKCPVCGAVYRPTVERETQTCRRCKADLSDLIRLHDQAIWYHRQALDLWQQGRYLEAATQNNQALALNYSSGDFHTLAGKLSALQGNFREAITSWYQALKFDPENDIASGCLEVVRQIQDAMELGEIGNG